MRNLVLRGTIWLQEGVLLPPHSGLRWRTATLSTIPSTHRFSCVALYLVIEDDLGIKHLGFAEETDWAGFISKVQRVYLQTEVLEVRLNVVNTQSGYVDGVVKEKLAPLEAIGVLLVEEIP